MDNNIRDFWTIKDTISDKEVLKQYAREFYTNDFIENYEKWKKNLKEINEIMKEDLKDYLLDFIDHYWQDMSFDYFCKNINDGIEKYIEKHGDITPEAIFDISQELVHIYLVYIIEEMDNKKLTLNNLLDSIKKVILL